MQVSRLASAGFRRAWPLSPYMSAGKPGRRVAQPCLCSGPLPTAALGSVATQIERSLTVESRCGAVAAVKLVGHHQLSGTGRSASPQLRLHIPLIEPDMQISRIRLSDKT